MLCSTAVFMGMRETLHWQGGTYCKLFGGQAKVSIQFSQQTYSVTKWWFKCKYCTCIYTVGQFCIMVCLSQLNMLPLFYRNTACHTKHYGGVSLTLNLRKTVYIGDGS
jgi:hypothetical protein